MVHDYLWKNPFLTQFGPFFGPKWPLFKTFWDFPSAKTRPTASARGANQKKAHKWARWLHDPIGRLRRPLAPWAHTFDN